VTLRILLVWGMVASLLAGCSGGASTGASGSAGSAIVPSAFTHTGALSLSFTVPTTIQSSVRRKAQFIGAGVNDVHFVFTPTGMTATSPNNTGDIPLNLSSSPPQQSVNGNYSGDTCTNTGNTGLGISEVCTIAQLPGTYNVSFTLQYCTNPTATPSPTGCIAVGTGTPPGGPFTLTGGQSTSVAVQISPILTGNAAGPSLSVLGGGTPVFYEDGNVNVSTVLANELDPAGNIITTWDGPVSNWVTLSFAGSTPGLPGVTLPNQIAQAPTAQNGTIVALQYQYNGTAPTQDLILQLSDGMNPSATLDYQFVGMTLSNITGATGGPGSGLAAGMSTPYILPANPGTATLTFKETTTSPTLTNALDMNFDSFTSCATVTGSPTIGIEHAATPGVQSASISFTLSTPASGSPETCFVAVQSYIDPVLTTYVWVRAAT
jgi:hypothetical protein